MDSWLLKEVSHKQGTIPPDPSLIGNEYGAEIYSNAKQIAFLVLPQCNFKTFWGLCNFLK